MARAKSNKNKAIVTPAATRYAESEEDESEEEKQREIIELKSDSDTKTKRKDVVSSDSSDSSDSGDEQNKKPKATKESNKPDLATDDPTSSTKNRDEDQLETEDPTSSTKPSRDDDPLSASKPNPYDSETNEDEAMKPRRLSSSPTKSKDQSSKKSGERTAPSTTRKTTSSHTNNASDPALNSNLTSKIEFNKSIKLSDYTSEELIEYAKNGTKLEKTSISHTDFERRYGIDAASNISSSEEIEKLRKKMPTLFRDRIVAGLQLQNERKSFMKNKMIIKQQVYNHIDEDLSCSEEEFSEDDVLLVKNMVKLPRANKLRFKFKREAMKKIKTVLARRERQTKSVCTQAYEAGNHSLWFQEFHMKVMSNNDSTHFQVKASDGHKYNVISETAKFKQSDINFHCSQIKASGTMKQKSALRNYFTGIYSLTNNQIKSRIFKIESLLDQNAIKLIWWLYCQYMMMYEYTLADITARVKALDIELVAERNILQFNYMVQTNLTLCLIHKVDTKMIEEAMKLSYNKCADCVSFALTLKTPEYKEADIEGKLALTQASYMEVWRDGQWNWKTVRKSNKHKRQEPDEQIALAASVTQNKPKKNKLSLNAEDVAKETMLLKAELNATKQKLNSLAGKVTESDGKIPRKQKRQSFSKDRNQYKRDQDKGNPWTGLSPMLNTKEKWSLFINGKNTTLGKKEQGVDIKGKWYYWCVHCNQYKYHSSGYCKNKQEVQNTLGNVAQGNNDPDHDEPEEKQDEDQDDDFLY